MQNTNQKQENRNTPNKERMAENQECMTTSLEESMRYLAERLKPDTNFDIV